MSKRFLLLFVILIWIGFVASEGKKTVVHLVPHSHTDIGWLNTVEGYFYQSNLRGPTFYQTSYVANRVSVHEIISEVIHALEDDESRRFVWQEM